MSCLLRYLLVFTGTSTPNEQAKPVFAVAHGEGENKTC